MTFFLQAPPLRPQKPETHMVVKLAVLENAFSLAALFLETHALVHPDATLIKPDSGRIDAVQIELLEAIVDQ